MSRFNKRCSRWVGIGSSRLADTKGYQAAEFAHLIDTTASMFGRRSSTG